MRKLFITLALLVGLSAPALAGNGWPPYNADERYSIDGHVVHFIPIAPAFEARLPRNFRVVSIDDQKPMVVAFDPNGPFGFPGVVSVGIASANLVLSGTTAAPILDLAAGITLSSGTAISFTNTTNAILSSQATGASSVGFSLQSQGVAPVKDFLVNSTTGGSTSLGEFDVNNVPKLTLDKNGNLTLVGGATATTGAFSGTITSTSNTPVTLNPGGTSCTTPCYAQLTNVAAGTQTLSFSTAASTDGVIIQNVNTNGSTTTATAANKLVQFLNGVTNEFSVTNAGVGTFNGAVSASDMNAGGNVKITKHLIQAATADFAGSCAMVTATTCTIAIVAAYVGTPLCFAIDQTTGATQIPATCALSGTTLTVSASQLEESGTCVETAGACGSQTFGIAFSAAPVCNDSESVGTAARAGSWSALSATAFTPVASTTGTNTIHWQCVGLPNNSHTFSAFLIGNPN